MAQPLIQFMVAVQKFIDARRHRVADSAPPPMDRFLRFSSVAITQNHY